METKERRARLFLDPEQIRLFCSKHHIRKLSLFGSVIGDDFGSDSDIDVLVEFEPGFPVGYIRMEGMRAELSAIVGGRVDLRTPAELSRYFRDAVRRTAEVQYEAG